MKKYIGIIAAILCVMGSICLCGCAGKEAETTEPLAAAEPAEEQEDSAETAEDNSEDEGDAPDTALSEDENETSDGMEQAEVDYEAIYAPVLSEVIDTIHRGYDFEKEYKYVSDGIIERILYPGDDDLMQAIGYVITDINDDGIKELMIGENADYEYDDLPMQSYIYSGFTYQDEKLVCFIEGWARSRQHYMGNGHFFNIGSSSAWSTAFGEWHLEKGGSGASWDDFYFSEEDGINGGIAFYHNTTGIYETDKAQRMDISDEDFYKIADDYKCELISWTPLAESAGDDSNAPAEKTLSQTELKDMEKKLNSIGYYGFLLSFYRDPRDIKWHEVFYDGAGYDRGYPSPGI
ncbi:MAG: hypothetical protein J5842_04440, partial [Lachnospiraceae bacterium]|nr:hypothetical protein [Lachnospiraceae bacterium]